MKKDIQKQLYRMSFVVLVMIAFAVWQRDFVVTAINSNVFLNSTIIATFLFGLGLTFKYLFGLNNELVAFEALQEKYNDIQRQDEEETDPFWRFQRCSEPAIIFSPPLIMWQAYFLISDEMSRTDNLKISAGTMQTLMDGIDTKLDDQKSLATYITGLLVFLGLIGTFVGLMVTLASVGKIIGDLDLSGGGGTEVIQKLMNNLQTPLQGMATGFSSSLFGLITSLALGLIVRFQNMAASSLRLSFEAWLSGVVHIADDADGISGAVSGAGGPGIDPRHLRLMYNVAKYTLTATNRTNRMLDRLTENVAGLAKEQARQGGMALELSAHMEKNAQYQSLMAYHLGRTATALEGHDEVALKLREIDMALNGRIDELAGVVDRSMGSIESLNEELIGLGAKSESLLDAEYERMMRNIYEAISEEPAAQAVGAENSIAGSVRSTGTVSTASTQLKGSVAGDTQRNSLGDLRKKLTQAYDSSANRDEDV